MYVLEAQVNKRIKSLRSQYIQARKPLASGSRSKQTKKNAWRMERLQFLENTIGCRPSTSTLQVLKTENK